MHADVPCTSHGAEQLETPERLRVLDRDEVQHSVAGIGVWRDDQPAPEASPVRDREQQERARAVAVARVA